ncbi:MAG: carboxypeptidase regulatory-like domain-containing protein [Candidatus Omnitrophica bacterium]|nr:carboxypeptidase regulatory-like domain-containing protein [Candidatus Omnitrophota bacterium]
MKKVRFVLCMLTALVFVHGPDVGAVTKPAKPRIDIKKISFGAEAKGTVPSGTPLTALVEVHATEDVAGPFEVLLTLKKGKDKQSFKEGIEKLNKGPNSFKWDLAGKPEDGLYLLTVEIAGGELKIKDRSTKSVRVGENKKTVSRPFPPEKTETGTSPQTAKPGKARINIERILLGSEQKGIVPSGVPLTILVDVRTSEDVAGPFAVALELKKAKASRKFSETIEKLTKGRNAFQWALADKTEEGPYSVSVEIADAGAKLKDKSTKSFRVGGKKKTTGDPVTSEGTAAATQTSSKAAQSTTTKSATTKAATSKSTTKKSATTKSGGTQSETEGPSDVQENGGKEDEDGGPDFGLVGGDEEDKDTSDINVTGKEIKELTVAGIKIKGKFIQQTPGIYLAQGEIKFDGFKISLGAAAGQIKVDKNKDRIEGEMYISVIGYGKIVQITDLILSKTQVKFKGKFEEKVTIPVVRADVSLAKGVADFEVATTRFACQAEGGIIIDVSVPKVGAVSFEIVSGGGGFATAIPPEGISVSGSGTVTIPFEPPLEVELEGAAEITKKSLSGKGSATLFSVLEVGNGDFEIQYNGIMTLSAKVGAFLSDYGFEASLADTKFTIDLPQRRLSAGLKQSIKILDLVTIPGSVKGDLLIDGKAKVLSVSGKAKVPLTGSAIGPDEISAGIQNFLIKVDRYDSRSPDIELNGELAISVWTLGGFKGKITGSVLTGSGDFYLPPGLKQLLDLEKISLPVKIDLKSAKILGDLGGDVAGLAIKHFPITGPTIIVKNDGVHLKGEIGIANVITVPLGDLVFTQTSSQTTVNGDLGIGPFTVAEGEFTLPAKETEGIRFAGKVGIPGLSGQRISGTVFKTGKVDLSGMTRLAFLTVDTLAQFDVSKERLHASKAAFGADLGGAARCSLALTDLDVEPSSIRGHATASFTGILGIGTALRGAFSFDGETVLLTYRDSVNLCGIGVDRVTLRIDRDGITGSGTITAAGQEKEVSITVENGVMKLKGPAGELIAEGMRIADQLAETAGDIAKEEAKVVGEDAEKTLDNLSRLTEPWVKEVVAVVRVVKGIYATIEKAVVDEVKEKAKTVLNALKDAADAAVLFAKKAIAAAVDAVCNGIIAMVDGVKAIFSQIESSIPADHVSAYNAIKNKVIEKGNAVKAKVVIFRDASKASLYDLTGTITAIYQGAIDGVTEEANKIAAGIKKELDPVIEEVDLLLTEIGEEIDLATSAAGDEAKRHYDIAKQKSEVLKKKCNSVVTKYKDKIGDLVAPYTKPVLEKIKSDQEKVAKERDAVIAQGIEGLKLAKKTLDPVIQPFEDAVKELRDLTSRIGGAVYQKFLEGVGAAGDALDTALGTAGKGLVKATDLVGDAAVAVSGAAADASQAVHEAAAATIEFVQDTGSQAVDAAVDTAQAGYQTATEAAAQAAAAADQAASQAYQTATQVAAAAERQAESTVNTVISHLPPVSPSSFATGSPVSFSDIQSGAQAISSKVSSILNTLDGYATSAYNAASGAASSVGSAVSSGASAAASGISSRWRSATRSISGLIGSSNPAPAPVLDYSAPEVTNIAATSTLNSITITWNTSFNSRTIIFYSATPTVNLTGQNATTSVASIHTGDNYPETTSHSITVSGLNPGTAYYYIVYAVHAMGSAGTTNAAKKGPFMVVTQPSTAIIGGLVKDAQGNAVPAAGIHIGSATTPAAMTDATGRYTLEVNPGAWTLSVKKENHITASATTPSLSAGQVLPLDFTLADGRVFISGVVKDAATQAALSGATVTLVRSPSNIGVQTGAPGTFTIVLGTSGSSTQLTMTVSKSGYTTYTSAPLSLAPGAKMQNIEIKLPAILPAFSADGVDVGPVTASTARVFFASTRACSAFVQLKPRAAASYAYQTPTQTNKTSFSFDLVGLVSGTSYQLKAVLTDGSGNAAASLEDFFNTAPAVTAATDIGLGATVTNITAHGAKLNVTSSFKTLKHRLILRDTTANTISMDRDLGLLVSPVSVDLNHLTDGHNYTADLTSALLSGVTSGSVLKTATKNVSFQTPRLKDVEIRDLKCDPGTAKRGTHETVNVSATIRINHAVTGAVLKVTTGAKELYSQNLGNRGPGELKVSVPLAVSQIPGTGPVTVQFKVQAAGNVQESGTKTLTISGAQNATAV